MEVPKVVVGLFHYPSLGSLSYVRGYGSIYSPYGDSRVVECRRGASPYFFSRLGGRVRGLYFRNYVRYYDHLVNGWCFQVANRYGDRRAALARSSKGGVELRTVTLFYVQGPCRLRRFRDSFFHLVPKCFLVFSGDLYSLFTGESHQVRHRREVLRRRTCLASTRLFRFFSFVNYSVLSTRASLSTFCVYVQ